MKHTGAAGQKVEIRGMKFIPRKPKRATIPVATNLPPWQYQRADGAIVTQIWKWRALRGVKA